MNADGLFRGPESEPVHLDRLEFIRELDKIFSGRRKHGQGDGYFLAGSDRCDSAST